MDIQEQIVNIVKANAYDIVSKQRNELKEENKELAAALTDLIKYDTDGENIISYDSVIFRAKAALKNRKPYNL